MASDKGVAVKVLQLLKKENEMDEYRKGINVQ